jgi:hypothetical protein
MTDILGFDVAVLEYVVSTLLEPFFVRKPFLFALAENAFEEALFIFNYKLYPIW